MVATSPFRPSKFYVAIPAIEPESSEYDLGTSGCRILSGMTEEVYFNQPA